MKLLKFGALLATSVLVMTGCSDENPIVGSNGEGGISPIVIADGTVEEVVPITRAEEQIIVPDANEFGLRLTKTDGTYDQSWETIGQFPVDESYPIGAYKMEAYYGNINEEGFDRP